MSVKPKIMTVYGTRPEAIKVAPVVSALQADDRFDSVVVSTGQHREMLEQVNKRFGITPDHDMALMKPGQTLNELVARAIQGLDPIIEEEEPDVIISQGDTSTAMVAALAGFHRGVKKRTARLSARLLPYTWLPRMNRGRIFAGKTSGPKTSSLLVTPSSMPCLRHLNGTFNLMIRGWKSFGTLTKSLF